MTTINPPCLHIDLENLKHNWKIYNDYCDGGATAVVKANAYSVGAEQIFESLVEAGCNDFWVATIAEAIPLRKVNKSANISVLEGLSSNNIDTYKKLNLVGVVNTPQQLQMWKDNPEIPVWIHIDTGMNRLGIAFDKALEILDGIDTPYGYMSHFASSEEFDNPFNRVQLKRFEDVVEKLPPAKTSIYNSNGVVRPSFDKKHQARVGIGLYGLLYCDLDLKPVLKLTATITKIDTLEKGATVGYNSTYVAEKTVKIAAVNIGYADGFNVNMSNTGYLYHEKQKYLVIGRVSMDTIVIDISHNNDFKVGDEITVFSSSTTSDDTDTIDLIEMADICNVSPHNSITNCRGRVLKNYIKG